MGHRHPNSIRNLEPFRKGHDARRNMHGPKGRVKARQDRLSVIVHLLDSETLSDEDRARLESAASEAIFEGAIAGDPILARKLFNWLLAD